MIMGESKEEKKIRTHFGVSNGVGHMMYLRKIYSPEAGLEIDICDLNGTFIYSTQIHVSKREDRKIGSTLCERGEVNIQNGAAGARFSLGVIK